MTSYQVDYAGYYAMSWHDREENALKRWFDNYKIERYASFACDTEWLVVKEVESTSKHRGNRLICEIGDDGRGTKREVIMDHTAPPAPILTFAAKRKYVPPPPKTADELRREAEWERMYAMGYEPRPRLRRYAMPNILNNSYPVMVQDDEIEIEWVPRRFHNYFNIPKTAYKAPEPPKHRRNV